jgi:asparagine synthase (glutamine-hydrolysing)
MCGFAGIINNDFPVHQKQLADVAACTQFRGPDSCGLRIYNEEMLESRAGIHAFFFNRLAIIDMDHRSDQPFEDERYSLLFNGEIYNYKELRETLLQKGYLFRTTSDTEVLFWALQCWGKAVLDRLNGMFAFCFIDRLEKTFIMARDRMGIKPLYYRRCGNGFIFASELHSLLRLSHQQAVIDLPAIKMYLWMQFIPTPYTGVKDVLKLPPGEYITGSWQSSAPAILANPEPFWNAYEAAQRNANGAVESDLEQMLKASLKHQLVADVPVGLFLSSGVDSSLLAAMVHKYFSNDRQFNFYTVAFSETTNSDESTDAMNFIKGFNNSALLNHTLVIDPDFIGEQLNDLYDYVDEPFADSAILLNRVISVKAREQVTVALSGDGADELFWGYNRYLFWRHNMLQLGNHIELKGGWTKWASYFLPLTHHRKLAALAAERDPVKRHFNYFLHPFFADKNSDPVYDKKIWAMKDIDRVRNRKDLTAIMDIKTYLPDAMLYKVDRSSMAASLEVRVPYLDNIVVDYALRLPLGDKSNSTFTHKAPLKKLLQQLAPHYQVTKPKKGFNFPLDKWLSTAWKEKTIGLVNSENLRSIGLNDREYLGAVRQYYKGEKRNCLPVWYLLNLVMWKQKLDQITPLHQL